MFVLDLTASETHHSHHLGVSTMDAQSGFCCHQIDLHHESLSSVTSHESLHSVTSDFRLSTCPPISNLSCGQEILSVFSLFPFLLVKQE